MQYTCIAFYLTVKDRFSGPMLVNGRNT